MVALRAVAAAALVVASAWQAAEAQSADDFYKGKTITFVVGFAPGGGYDLYARVVAHHIGKHIPGRPNTIVQNMAGAGSIRAANFVYAAAPKDGTVIASVVQDMTLFQLLGSSGVQYDATRFAWLGGVVASNSMLYAWHATGIKRWEDAKLREVVLGSTGITSSMVARTMNALLGTKFKLVQGYATTPEITLAMERGEMMGSGGTTWAGLQISSRELIAKGMLNFLVQTGARKEPEIEHVPLFLDLAELGGGEADHFGRVAPERGRLCVLGCPRGPCRADCAAAQCLCGDDAGSRVHCRDAAATASGASANRAGHRRPDRARGCNPEIRSQSHGDDPGMVTPTLRVKCRLLARIS